MKRRFEYSIFVLIALCIIAPTRACMNDRDSDSLAEEGRDLPDVVRVITGRFERNPPLFYQMRVNRVEKELRAAPRLFNLYDDISVALDRLGRDDEAIAWIEKKRALLPKLNAQDRVLKEHWYRYYANGGTFWAHRWLRAGANRKTIAEMVRARDMIARAIKIKPDAHFGREKYQLAAMNWIIKAPKIDDGHLSTFVKKHESNDAILKAQVEGLSGLVVLGNAWESVDVFFALKNTLEQERNMSLAYLAQLRSLELVEKGKKSLVPIPQHRDLRYFITQRNYDAIGFRDQNEVERA